MVGLVRGTATWWCCRHVSIVPRYNARATHIRDHRHKPLCEFVCPTAERRVASFPACFIQPVPHQLIRPELAQGVEVKFRRLFFGLLLTPLSLSLSRGPTTSFVRLPFHRRCEHSFVFGDGEIGWESLHISLFRSEGSENLRLNVSLFSVNQIWEVGLRGGFRCLFIKCFINFVKKGMS